MGDHDTKPPVPSFLPFLPQPQTGTNSGSTSSVPATAAPTQRNPLQGVPSFLSGLQNGTGNAQHGATTPINWTTDTNVPADAKTAADYNIHSTVDPKTGNYVVTSNNIRMEIKPTDMNLPLDDPEKMNKMLADWRAKKDKDDTLAYDKSTEQMLAETKNGKPGERYYDSEQHEVWAYAASARTGGKIPPEFFMEFDPNGGTAGNGPNVLTGGHAGEPLSTIAMGHDTDWNLGRYMDTGPLKGLHDLNPTDKVQMQRMGNAGLFNSADSKLIASRPPTVNLNPLQGFQLTPEQKAQNAEDDRIGHVLDSVPYYYHGGTSDPMSNAFNNPNNPDWKTQYTPGYSKFGNNNVNILGHNFNTNKYSEQFLWDGKNPATGNAINNPS